jgi:hypothetical protein
VKLAVYKHVRNVAGDSNPKSPVISFDTTYPKLEELLKMATQLCQKCKQAHPGRVCDYDDKAECAETIAVDEVAQPRNEPPKQVD